MELSPVQGFTVLLIPFGAAAGFPVGWFVGRYAKRPIVFGTVLLFAPALLVIVGLLAVVIWAVTAPGQGTGAGLVIVLGLVVGAGFAASILWTVFAVGLGLGIWAGSWFRVRKSPDIPRPTPPANSNPE